MNTRLALTSGMLLAMCLLPSSTAQEKNGAIRKPGNIQKPAGTWQKPGEIQKPSGPWQVPKGIQAISRTETKCQQRLTVGADALFEFDSAALTKDAEETLSALGPMIRKAGEHPVVIEGHTDAKGADAYNQTLSRKRAEAVRFWLTEHQVTTQDLSSIKAFGKTKPVAPNTRPDGSDDPEGRRKNRRVEIVIDTCK